MRKLLVLLLVLLPVLAFAAQPTDNYIKPGSYGSIFNLPYTQGHPSELAAFAAPAILVCIALAALAYMVGEALDMPTVKAYAKGEALELGNTIVIFVFLLAALFVFSVAAERMYPNITYTDTGGVQKASGVCGYYVGEDEEHPNPPTMFSMADYFLGCMPFWDQQKTGDGVMLPKLVEIYISLMQLETILGILSTLGASINLPQPVAMLPTVSVAFHAGLSIVSDAHTLIVDAVGMGIVIVVAQKAILEFIYASVLKYFLPLGILMRALPFTRKTGSTVIAVCCVFYFVYPSSIMINKYVFDTYVTLPTEEGEYGQMGRRLDFVEYKNAIEVCEGETAKSVWKGDTPLIHEGIEWLEEYKNRIYTQPGNRAPSHKAVERADEMGRFAAGLLTTANTVANFDKLGGIFAFFVPYAPLLGNYFYDAITHELTVATQFLTWNLIFLVSSIFITLTMFKDVSLAIGGEIRIFGITKVV